MERFSSSPNSHGWASGVKLPGRFSTCSAEPSSTSEREGLHSQTNLGDTTDKPSFMEAPRRLAVLPLYLTGHGFLGSGGEDGHDIS